MSRTELHSDFSQGERRVPVKDALAVASWIGAGINMADAMNILYPEEAAKMEELNVIPGPRYFVNSNY